MQLGSVTQPGSLAVAAELSMEGVSAETLLTFLSTRLEGIDREIAEEIAFIDSQGKASNATSMRRELLDSIAGEIRLVTDKASKKVNLNELMVTWEGREMTAAAAISAAGLEETVAFSDAISGGLPGSDSTVTLQNVETASSKLEKEQKRLTSDNDLRMLRLQDITSRRSQVIQMVSNFMRSFQDAHRNIVGNMR